MGQKVPIGGKTGTVSLDKTSKHMLIDTLGQGTFDEFSKILSNFKSFFHSLRLIHRKKHKK